VIGFILSICLLPFLQFRQNLQQDHKLPEEDVLLDPITIPQKGQYPLQQNPEIETYCYMFLPTTHKSKTNRQRSQRS